MLVETTRSRRGLGPRLAIPRLAIPLVAVTLVAAATACSRVETPMASRAFCRAADRYNTELERQAERGEIDVDRQVTRVEALVRTAPRAIADDAAVFLDALRRVRTDPSVRDDPGVEDAVDNVNRYANQACNVYKRDGGV
jgi:hypothetical protein